jgi:flavin reductase (DIM6/NTAB) family NADH-FMN oxidoreductase RutF
MATPDMSVKLTVPQQNWDAMFAPSSCLAIITTVDTEGRVNAAAFATCTRVLHNPVYVAFTTSRGKDTAENALATRAFVVNTPAFEPHILDRVLTVAFPFERGVNELDRAGFTSIAAEEVAPPRVVECNRHFECEVEWTREWAGGRLMVCGQVVAVSADADCIGADGLLVWERARPAHYCGGRFVAAYETYSACSPYQGPEAEAYEVQRRQVLNHP